VCRGTPLFTIEDAIAAGSYLADNAYQHHIAKIERGDPDGQFKNAGAPGPAMWPGAARKTDWRVGGAAFVVSGDLHTKEQYHFYMETQTTIGAARVRPWHALCRAHAARLSASRAAIPEEDKLLRVYASTQGPQALRSTLVGCTNLPANKIVVSAQVRCHQRRGAVPLTGAHARSTRAARSAASSRGMAPLRPPSGTRAPAAAQQPQLPHVRGRPQHRGAQAAQAGAHAAGPQHRHEGRWQAPPHPRCPPHTAPRQATPRHTAARHATPPRAANAKRSCAGRYKAGVDAQGKVIALTIDLYSDGGSAYDACLGCMDMAQQWADGAYFFPNYRSRGCAHALRIGPDETSHPALSVGSACAPTRSPTRPCVRRARCRRGRRAWCLCGALRARARWPCARRACG
jgi:hypothetical protein